MIYDRSNPLYNASSSDYSTNADSYYNDLARKERLIKELSLLIAGYDEKITGFLVQWQNNLVSFDDDVLTLLEKWLADGTLGDILTVEFLSGKSNIVTSATEPTNPNNQTYWNKITGTIDNSYPSIGGGIVYDEI